MKNTPVPALNRLARHRHDYRTLSNWQFEIHDNGERIAHADASAGRGVPESERAEWACIEMTDRATAASGLAFLLIDIHHRLERLMVTGVPESLAHLVGGIVEEIENAVGYLRPELPQDFYPKSIGDKYLPLLHLLHITTTESKARPDNVLMTVIPTEDGGAWLSGDGGIVGHAPHLSDAEMIARACNAATDSVVLLMRSYVYLRIDGHDRQGAHVDTGCMGCELVEAYESAFGNEDAGDVIKRPEGGVDWPGVNDWIASTVGRLQVAEQEGSWIRAVGDGWGVSGDWPKLMESGWTKVS